MQPTSSPVLLLSKSCWLCSFNIFPTRVSHLRNWSQWAQLLWTSALLLFFFLFFFLAVITFPRKYLMYVFRAVSYIRKTYYNTRIYSCTYLPSRCRQKWLISCEIPTSLAPVHWCLINTKGVCVLTQRLTAGVSSLVHTDTISATVVHAHICISFTHIH